MYSHLAEPFLTMAKSVWSLPELHWIEDSVTANDLALLEAEANPAIKYSYFPVIYRHA